MKIPLLLTVATSTLALLASAALAADGDQKSTATKKTHKTTTTTSDTAHKAPAKSDTDPAAGKPTDPDSQAADRANAEANQLRESVDKTLQNHSEAKPVQPEKTTPK